MFNKVLLLAGDEIDHAVKRCWASLFSRQSVEYRRLNGQPIDTAMSVVVQAMVDDPTAAGVVFSRCPATGDPSKVDLTQQCRAGFIFVRTIFV